MTNTIMDYLFGFIFGNLLVAVFSLVGIGVALATNFKYGKPPHWKLYLLVFPIAWLIGFWFTVRVLP